MGKTWKREAGFDEGRSLKSPETLGNDRQRVLQLRGIQIHRVGHELGEVRAVFEADSLQVGQRADYTGVCWHHHLLTSGRGVRTGNAPVCVIQESLKWGFVQGGRDGLCTGSTGVLHAMEFCVS